MTLPFTREQLDQLQRRMLRQAPPKISREDVGKSTIVGALTVATTCVGLLVKFRSPSGDVLRLLNPVVTIQLFIEIGLCGDAADWWVRSQEWSRDPTIAPPEPDDLPRATEVVSFATAVADAGIVVSFVQKDGRHELLLLNPVLATDLFLYICIGAKGLGWWDENHALLPATEEQRMQ